MLGHSLSLNACRVYRKTALEDGLGEDADVIWADLAFFLAASTLPAYCGAFFLQTRLVGGARTWAVVRNSAFSEREREGRGVPAGMTASV